MPRHKSKTSESHSQSLGHKLPDKKNSIIFIVGPTAVGKTEIAVKIARKINAEIISCDSMQVYRGMDILSSMPSAKLRKNIRHHLVRFLDPGKEYNVAKYRAQALRIVKGIRQNDKVPLFVGGTGHYMSILIDGLFRDKPQNRSVRNRLYRLAQEKGSVYLYGCLKQVDPAAAARVHPHDTKRIVRALEVYETLGRPISELQKERRGLGRNNKIMIFCLSRDRPQLYEKINRRVERMFKQGLVSEVRKLIKRRLSKTAACAIGIPEIKGYLNGDYDLGQARLLIQRNSRRLAKRQLTWFKKDKRIEWILCGPGDTTKELAGRIQERLWG